MPLHTLGDLTPVTPADGHYWIAPTATVIGRVTIGSGVGIWFGAVVRGDGEAIVIGDDTNLQEHVVVHTDPSYPATIGAGCTVGHRAIIHGCTIGANVLIGMGAIILNGAVIGDNSLVGAGALVTEGKIIPPGSLVIGAPGKVARPLTENEIVRNRQSATHYAANWRRFARDFR